MKRKLCTALLMAVIGLTICGAAFAGDHFFADIDDATIGNLEHQYAYEWGIDFSIPQGEVVTGAELSFASIYNWADEPDDILYVHLLSKDSVPPFAWGVEYDNEGGGDFFDGEGPLLFTYTDTTDTQPENFVYSFTQEQVGQLTDALSDGNFGIGLDPDCHYFNDGVQMKITTKVVPEPISTVLFLVGGGALAGVRRLRRKA